MSLSLFCRSFRGNHQHSSMCPHVAEDKMPPIGSDHNYRHHNYVLKFHIFICVVTKYTLLDEHHLLLFQHFCLLLREPGTNISAIHFDFGVELLTRQWKQFAEEKKKKRDCLQALLNMCRLRKWKHFQYEHSQALLFKIVDSCYRGVYLKYWISVYWKLAV